MSPAQAFGRALRIKRHAASLTQKTLARQAGRSRAFISRLENGGDQPTITTILLLAAGLGCSAEDLVAETEAQMNGATAGSPGG